MTDLTFIAPAVAVAGSAVAVWLFRRPKPEEPPTHEEQVNDQNIRQHLQEQHAHEHAEHRTYRALVHTHQQLHKEEQ